MEICSDKNELHHILGIKNGSDWIRGGIAAGKIAIISPLNPPSGSDYNNVINTAVHEFVHIILSEINDKIPRWLDEGTASYEGNDNNIEWIKNTVKDGLEKGNIPQLMQLDTGQDYEKFLLITGINIHIQ